MDNLQLELFHSKTHDDENENSHCLEETMMMTATINKDKDGTDD